MALRYDADPECVGFDESVIESKSAARTVWPIVVVYMVATFLVSGVLLVLQGALSIDDEIISIVQFAPSLGLLAVVPFARGRVDAGLSTLRGVGPRLLAVLTSNVLIFGGCVAVFAVLGDDLVVTRPVDLERPFVVILVFQFIGACGEELGWRCFLQPLLQTRFSLVVSAVIVGLLWGVWHVQYFAFGPVVVAGFLLATVSMSIIMAVMIDRAPGGKLLIAGTFHWLINIGLLLLMDEESGAAEPMVAFGCCCAVAAVGVLVGAKFLQRESNRSHPITPSLAFAPPPNAHHDRRGDQS